MSDLPDGWAYTTVDAVAAQKKNAIKAGPFGSALKKDYYVPSGFKIYGQEQVLRADPAYGDYYISKERYETLRSCAVEPRDVLLSLVGTIGRTLILPRDAEPGIINPRLVKITLDEQVMLPEYFAYVLQSPSIRASLKLAAHGGTMDVINLTVLRRLKLPLPPRHEQDRIVAAIEEQFSRLDAGLAALDRAQRNAKRALRSLAAMASAPDTSKDWKQVTLADIADIESGPAFSSARFGGPGEGVKLLRGDNIEPGALRWTNIRTWPADEARGLGHLLVNVGDLILGMDRPVISTGFKLAPVRPADLPALLVQRVARIRPRPGVSPRFLHVALLSPRFMPHVMRSQTGTQIPHITLAGIRSFPMALPSLGRQMEIVEEFEDFSERLEHAERIAVTAATRAGRLRGAILAAAFSGQLVSREAQL